MAHPPTTPTDAARHAKLRAKEFRTERNHPVVFAIDTGRLMCDPLLGVPRIDRALLKFAFACTIFASAARTADLAVFNRASA